MINFQRNYLQSKNLKKLKISNFFNFIFLYFLSINNFSKISIKEHKQLKRIIKDFNNINICETTENFNNNTTELKFLQRFTCKYIDTWIDNDSNLYVQQEFCENGDLLDYMTKLENLDIQGVLSVEFYWDLIFEILCVS